mmetsp:Transcript_51247/g.81660  ORF Transcript_51247/g.81660 Transcript_51247/m.81660 type:complete len:351 (+) Transcript_51247:73-1125(+)
MSDSETMNTELDLEAKEQQLRLLNEQLDARREQIVERAEKLLNEQMNLLKHTPSAATVDINDIDDHELDIPHHEDEEALPRTLIPKQTNLDNNAHRKNQDNHTQKQAREVPEMKTPDNENDDVSNTQLNDLRVESEILSGTTIGKDAELRLQRARYKALQKQVANMVQVSNEKEKQLMEKDKLIKHLESKLKKQEKERESLNSKMSLEKKESAELIKKCKRLEHELYSVQSDFNEYKKETKQKTESMKSNHIRLNRALEDAEKYRNLLTRYKEEHKNSNQVHNSDLLQLRNENRVLIKQKNELLSAFKKQLKLIDILKKQKIHLESAKVLQFTEQQFIKTLDIGQSMMNQ